MNKPKEELTTIAHLLERAKESEAKLLKISEILSERHGDDGRFEGPEDEYNDDPEVITIKRIFAIIVGDVTHDEVHGPGGYYDSGAR